MPNQSRPKFPKARVIALSAMTLCAGALLCSVAASAQAGSYGDTIALFKSAGQSAAFFGNSYGYAVFPTIGEGGLVVGGAHGDGHVYRHGRHVGDTSMTQVSVGAQAGGKAYSEIIFFADKRAFDEFTAGNLQLGVDASVVAITAGAGAEAGTAGAHAGASAGPNDARTSGSYHHGIVVFTIPKGGLMFDAAVAGQKFSYRELGS
jgi:lipid-binding SYLF domain-containing protein